MGIQGRREEQLEKANVTGHLARGDIEESFRLVLENGISPYAVPALQMRAMLKLRRGENAIAEQMTDTAISMRNDAIGWKMKGDACYLQCKYAEAETAYRKALAINPKASDILHDLGVSIVAQGRTSECLEYFDRAIALQPDRADYHHHYAIMLILDGQESAGWDRMQWRLKVPGVTGSFPFPDKYWKGEDLSGKTLVVRTEQGWGDGIMFMRYFPWLLARAKKVYFYGQRQLIPLIRDAHPEVHCWPHDCPVPLDFDYHVNIMCLPRLIPQEQPAPPQREGGKGVGICWYGSPTHKADHLRSVPVERFGALADVMDEPFVSLGYGYFWKLENGIAVGEEKPDFIEYSEVATAHDWLDTVRAVSKLNLVITVDTAIAHCAAYAGVETWLLLPHVPDFRWGMKGERTKWYPAMRLYRQPALHDWDSVFDKVAEDLKARYP